MSEGDNYYTDIYIACIVDFAQSDKSCNAIVLLTSVSQNHGPCNAITILGYTMWYKGIRLNVPKL